jgi:hypothetical protein
VNQECGLGLIGFDQGHLQVGPGDLQRETWQAGSGADVDHLSRVSKVVEQHQRILEERRVGPGHQSWPFRDESPELAKLRIVH